MKKLFIFVICAIVALSTAAAVSAGELKTSDTMLDFLETIGIIHTETDAPEDGVTREVFAVYVARMLGINETGESGTRYFVDLENNAFSQYSVNALAERGIIAVPEDRYFRPGEGISYEEAVKMLVCALGYEKYAEYRGGYPQGYLATAEALKISCTVQDRAQLKVSEAAELVYKTLVAPVCAMDITDGIATIFESEDSLLAQQFDIQWQEGTVTKIAGQSMNSDGPLPMDQAEINAQRYGIGTVSNAGAFLGSYVKYFYEINSEELVFISNEVQKTDDIVIDIDLLEDFTGAEISYYKSFESTRAVTQRLKNPTVVYNGIYLGDGIKELVSTLNKGTITLKDSDNDSAYDVVSIWDYKNFLVSAADETNGKLYNKLATEPKELSFDEFNVVNLRDEMGNTIELSDIEKDTVASVAISKDAASYAEIVVSTTEFNGTLTGISSSGGEHYVLVDSVQYRVDSSYYDTFIMNTVVGGTYYYKLDMFGKIAYVQADGTKEYNLGYVRRLSHDWDGCYLGLLTEDCTFVTATLAEKVKIDGRNYKQTEKLYEVLYAALGVNDTAIQNRFIRYMVDEEGAVTEIDTLTVNTNFENDKNSMTAVYAKDNAEKVFSYSGTTGNTTRTFGRAALITPNTKVFLLPGGVEEPTLDACYVGPYTNVLKENIRYTGNAYKFSSLNAYADAVVAIYDLQDLDGNTNGSKYAFLIDEITKGLNGEDEIVQYVHGYANGVEQTLEAAADFDLSGLKCGDVVCFEYDVNKNIAKNGSVEKLYDSETEYPNWGIDPVTGCRLREEASYTQVFQASFGNVVRVVDNCIFWAAEGYKNIVDSADASSINIAVYDSETGTVKAGSVNDIYDAESRGANCSKIMYVTRDNVGRCIYIFN